MAKAQKIDRMDLKILAALQSSGRMSNLELAAKVGLSASPAMPGTATWRSRR